MFHNILFGNGFGLVRMKHSVHRKYKGLVTFCDQMMVYCFFDRTLHSNLESMLLKCTFIKFHLHSSNRRQMERISSLKSNSFP